MAGKTWIEEATPAHARALAADLRPEELAECAALGAVDPGAEIQRSLELSEVAFALVCDGEVAGIVGLVPRSSDAVQVPEGFDAIWFLTGNAFPRHAKAFMRMGRDIVRAFLAHRPRLANFIDARYRGAIRLAEWLGGVVSPPAPFGALGLPFCMVTFGGT